MVSPRRIVPAIALALVAAGITLDTRGRTASLPEAPASSASSAPAVSSASAASVASAEAAVSAAPRVADLAARVVIRRDTYGVPHILAKDDETAGFGLGYAQAEDHAAEMGRRYLAARGDAARWFGPQFQDADLAMKRMANIEGARAALADTGDGYRRWLRGFVAGVNTYVAEHRADLPPWMPVVEEADILAHGRRDAVLAALRPPPRERRDGTAADVARASGIADPCSDGSDESRPAIDGCSRRGAWRGLAADDSAPGSNALAIAGSRTESGRPILLANPHLRWSALYWEAHVTVPGRYNFYGSLTVGLAVLRAGFNERLGYAQTNNAPDVVDHYAVPLDTAAGESTPRAADRASTTTPEAGAQERSQAQSASQSPSPSSPLPERYRFNGRSEPFRQQTVSVDVLQPDGRVETVTRTFLATSFGPVVQRTAPHAIVTRSAALQAWRFHEGFYDLLAARDLESFQRIMARQRIPTSNFTYADADGNIQYLWNARLPRRDQTDVDYGGVVAGEDPRYFWEGVHPLADLPRVLNPPGGYVQNANNAPWFATARDRLDPARYPPYAERRDLALRPQVALLELEARRKFSVDDVRRLKHTMRVLLAERVLPDLFQAADGGDAATRSSDLRQGLAILRAWDRQASSTSRGTALFIRFWTLYEQGREQPFREPWSDARPIETPVGLADPQAALRALEKAVAVVRERHGAPDVAWGDVNRFRFGDVDLPGNGAPGGYGLYRVLSFDDAPESGAAPATSAAGAAPRENPSGTQGDGGGSAGNTRDRRAVAGRLDADTPIAGTGDGWVLLVHFTRPVTAWSVLAYGQSSDFASPHSRDQIRLFADQRLRPVWFTEADIRAHLEREYRPGLAATAHD